MNEKETTWKWAYYQATYLTSPFPYGVIYIELMKNGYEENGSALLKILTLYCIKASKDKKCLKGSWKENKFDSCF